MKQGAVIALDLATTTGWAWHRPGMPRPFFGALPLPGDVHDIGKRADRLERFLREIALVNRASGGLTHFFYEEQHIGMVGQGAQRRLMNPATIMMLAGLAAIVEKFAVQTNAMVYKQSISEWRKHFIGRGSGFKARGEDPKELAIRRCAQYGWHTDIADAAEACGILDYSLTMLPDYVRPWRDKALMGGRV